MARQSHTKHPKMRKERIAYGILISALGCLWLADELGWLSTTLPLGPIIVILLGFTMLLPWLEK
ncbi:TPA: hypothetical protein HA225_02540 [Candidatus Micrarchaeota archaeon]|nr:hypothetical protein [Candidatus Micrarchaeota archaeon]HIH30515.1 hypothetical protein [Candidatus Micrarchaeota archaeon]